MIDAVVGAVVGVAATIGAQQGLGWWQRHRVAVRCPHCGRRSGHPTGTYRLNGLAEYRCPHCGGNPFTVEGR